ncbi:Rhamnose mutarotase [gut metagenome]|uniref:Rhamnose mutarotase n=1 Tax=gut metagenome TaxID=749906 RepID=J9H5C4_9ZZZZ
MEDKKQGYLVQEYHGPVKRYCQMLSLKDDPELIAEYRKRHAEGKVWPETLAAIREVGILEMEIYILGTQLFMIVETPLDFDWETAMARMATLPRQAEWEEYMSIFQQADPGASSAEKWQLMDRMFHLYP